MAPNGTSRKTPAASKPIQREDSTAMNDMFDEVDGENAKQAKDDEEEVAAGLKKAGSWDAENATRKPHTQPKRTNTSTNSSQTVKDSNPSSTHSSPHSSAPMSKVPTSIAKAFPTSQPLQDKSEVLKCTHCKRAVGKSAMPKHIESCLNRKQEKQRKKKEAKDARDAAARKERNGTVVGDSDDDDEGDLVAGGKKELSDKTGSKKRKADAEAEEPTTGPAKKKKKKDNANNASTSTTTDPATGLTTTNKPKPPRPKAPVDVEKQCGVELPQGGQCARSLTCKSHSMGAKRAVPGRSAPYDKLLMEYQRKNQAKLQKAQFDAAAPLQEEGEGVERGFVDSEDELERVGGAIREFWGGRPLFDRGTMVPLREKYVHQRIRGMVRSALGNRGGGGLFGNGSGGGFFGGGGAAAGDAPRVDELGQVHARRGSVVPGARTMMAPVGAGNRKGSVAAAAAAT